jgi:hypothetical protein
VNLKVLHLRVEKPNFEAAVTKFQEFLKANHHSDEITWVQPDDVLLTGEKLVYVRVPNQKTAREIARKTYEEGMPRRRGVLFRTICDLGSTTCSHAWTPENDDEAEGLLMPEGLKLTIQADRIKGVSIKSGVQWAYLRIRYRRKQNLRKELFR